MKYSLKQSPTGITGFLRSFYIHLFSVFTLQVSSEEKVLVPRPVAPVVALLSLCFLLMVPLCLADTDQARGKETTENYSCSMHPQIRMEKPAKCPICLLELIPVYEPPEKPISVPEGKLQEFCEAYITEAMSNIEKEEPFKAHAIVASYVDIYGKDSVERLRELLKSSSLEWVAVGAFHLGQMGDRKSIPTLKQLLASNRLQLPEMTFECPNHPQDTYFEPGRCPKCQTELLGSLRGDLMNARFLIAGALHAMNQPAGLEALKEMLRNPYYRAFAYGPLALRDTRDTRQLLEAGAQSEHEYHRVQAIESLLRLGDNRYIEQAIKLLDSSNEPVRYSAIRGLAKVCDFKAQEALVKFLKRKDINLYEQLAAAQGLVALGKQEYIKFIVDACANASSDRDASSEFLALGEVGGMEHLPLLKNAIEKNTHNRIWAVAAAIKILNK